MGLEVRLTLKHAAKTTMPTYLVENSMTHILGTPASEPGETRPGRPCLSCHVPYWHDSGTGVTFFFPRVSSSPQRSGLYVGCSMSLAGKNPLAQNIAGRVVGTQARYLELGKTG